MIETKSMTLGFGDCFTLSESNPDSLFDGLNIFVRNNGGNKVNVTSDSETIIISIEKPKQ